VSERAHEVRIVGMALGRRRDHGEQVHLFAGEGEPHGAVGATTPARRSTATIESVMRRR
jgi:hypothetical protein